MPSDLFTKNALELALDRVLLEHAKKQVFVTSPGEVAAVGACRDRWVDRLWQSLEDDSYNPSPAQHCDVPKSRTAVRPGTLLVLADQVVYNACVGVSIHSIVAGLEWANPSKDHAYRVRAPDARDWLKLAYACWNDFRKTSTAQLDRGALLMVSTDITAFYEHVSHELLMSDLLTLGAPDVLTAFLGRCLRRWSVINGRGLPQSLVASHLLAKVYLNVVDRSLHDAGFRHCRYVDDIRIFCSDVAEAKRALLHLTGALRRRGLSLQSAKTKLMAAGQARDLVEGVIPTLSPLTRLYLNEIAELLGVNPDYLTVTEAEEALARQQVQPPTTMLRHAYQAHFLDDVPFEKTLFHYLLARLGAAKDSFAADHALSLLEGHPEETGWILNYIAAVRPPESADNHLVSYLLSPEAVYPYQHYLVMRWRAEFLAPPSDTFLGLARQIHGAAHSPPYLRAAAKLMLALHGSPADLDNLAASYALAVEEVARAECLLSIYRLERSQRNALFGQARSDGMLPAAAIGLVKENKLPAVLGAS